jgi:gluconate 2-dehydrogenase alpha chain
VILCSYTFENVRLLLLSGDGRHPNGLGNNTGQVGKHFMTKMFAHVDGHFPDTVSTVTPPRPPRLTSWTTS